MCTFLVSVSLLAASALLPERVPTASNQLRQAVPLTHSGKLTALVGGIAYPVVSCSSGSLSVRSCTRPRRFFEHQMSWCYARRRGELSMSGRVNCVQRNIPIVCMEISPQFKNGKHLYFISKVLNNCFHCMLWLIIMSTSDVR